MSRSQSVATDCSHVSRLESLLRGSQALLLLRELKLAQRLNRYPKKTTMELSMHLLKSALYLLLFLSFLPLVNACGATTEVVKESAFERANEADMAARFDSAFEKNLKAASSHYWDVIDCKVRDEETGMPQAPFLLARAARSFIDSTEYTATYVFALKEGEGDPLAAFALERFKANLPQDYALDVSEDGRELNMAHQQRPDDFVSVSLVQAREFMYLRFQPQAKDEIPWGNPCLKAEVTTTE